MRLSQSAFAKVIGVTPQAIAKHVRAGKIAVGGDGLLDVEAACAAIGRKLTAARREHAQRLEQAAASDARRTPSLPGESPEALALAGVKLKREQIKLEREAIELRRFRKELVDKGAAYAKMFDYWRTTRDMFVNWPPRVAAVIGAEAGCDPRVLLTVLEREVEKLLAEVSRHAEKRDQLLEDI
jgi:hypothetical protein